MSQQPPLEGWLQLPSDIAQRLLELQLSFADALDSKIGLFVSVGAALLPVMPAVVAIRNKPAGFWEVALMFCSVAAFALVAYFGIWGLWSRRWALGPDLQTTLGDARYRPDQANLRVVTALRHSLEANRRGYSDKLLAFKWTLVALIAEAIAVYVGLLLLIVGL